MSTNFHNAQRRGFAKGGGTTYTCRICKRVTRPTGTGDNDGVQLCVECFDLAGEENSLSDNGCFYGGAQEVLGNIKSIESKGGDVTNWAAIKATAEQELAA